jgi:hypothetical protein
MDGCKHGAGQFVALLKLHFRLSYAFSFVELAGLLDVGALEAWSHGHVNF